MGGKEKSGMTGKWEERTERIVKLNFIIWFDIKFDRKKNFFLWTLLSFALNTKLSILVIKQN